MSLSLTVCHVVHLNTLPLTAAQTSALSSDACTIWELICTVDFNIGFLLQNCKCCCSMKEEFQKHGVQILDLIKKNRKIATEIDKPPRVQFTSLYWAKGFLLHELLIRESKFSVLSRLFLTNMSIYMPLVYTNFYSIHVKSVENIITLSSQVKVLE